MTRYPSVVACLLSGCAWAAGSACATSLACAKESSGSSCAAAPSESTEDARATEEAVDDFPDEASSLLQHRWVRPARQPKQQGLNNNFQNRIGQETEVHARKVGKKSCGIFAGDAPLGRLDAQDQALLTLTSSGTAVGVAGSECATAVAPHWAKWEYGEGCSGSPPFWAALWQGTASVADDGHGVKRVQGKIKVPPVPKAKGVDVSYNAWLMGMQPAVQPGIKNMSQWCDMFGSVDSMAYNSGQFGRIFYQTPNFTKPPFDFDKQLYNRGLDHDGTFIFASNGLLGQSAHGPTFGYGGVCNPGEEVWLDARLGKHYKELSEAKMVGWEQRMGVAGTNVEVTLAFNNSVYEDVFVESAVSQGLIEPDGGQALLVESNTWSWAVGPVYENMFIAQAPPLTEIPKLWPEGDVHFTDIKLELTEGGEWKNLTDKPDPWFLQFSQGLALGGEAFDGRLFLFYSELDEYFQELKQKHPKAPDYPQKVCLYQCIVSRYNGSECEPKTWKADATYDCVVKFGTDFPPAECTDEYWTSENAWNYTKTL